jgi:hypothetical protein
MTTPPGTRCVDGGDLSELVDADHNHDVVRYLAEHRPSCHSDTGQALLALLRAAAEKCGEWVAYSPSFLQQRYVALVTDRRIFALGIGQWLVCYRLSQESYAIALQTGATEAGEMGQTGSGSTSPAQPGRHRICHSGRSEHMLPPERRGHKVAQMRLPNDAMKRSRHGLERLRRGDGVPLTASR